MSSAATTRPHAPLELRPYQREAARAIVESVMRGEGRIVTVEIARQGGKNEISAQVEMFLLGLHAWRGGDVIKCAPTFEPQLQVSMRRLWSCLSRSPLRQIAKLSAAQITVGAARIQFLSADPQANVVGHTASLLLEVDEAQDVDPDKFDRDFRPMAAAHNATTVLYGTAWHDRTLLERAKQANLEAERRDGIRRHFEYDWQAVAEAHPAYGRYARAERERLGAGNPLFVTQYCLRLLPGGGRLLGPAQLAQLRGEHARVSSPAAGETCVAGLDIAGGDDAGVSSRRDSTVLTIGRLVYAPEAAFATEPRVEIVEHVAWTGEPHETLLPRLADLLRNAWRVAGVAVDATGIGETAARLLGQALGGHVVKAVRFSTESKSLLGFDLLAAINGGRLKAYAGDGSPEHREFWRQMESARVAYRANQAMNFFVDPADGHDDYLMSAALLVHASRGRTRRTAVGRVRVP